MIPPILKPHIRKYNKCKNCIIGCIDDKRVYYRGPAKCDILFVGDYPTDVDISIGESFSGPPGHLLDTLIHEAGLDEFRITYTQAVVCNPVYSLGGKQRKPTAKEIKNCSPRLDKFISLSRPRKLVAVGPLAASALSILKKQFVQIIHPTAIQANPNNANIDMARVIHTLKKLKKELT